MGTIWVKDFNGGLDTRRLPETTAGGVLLVAKDGHITRGGEFEQRAAFVPEYELPSGTVGLFHDTTGLVVFGSGDPPVLPSGISYQKLAHPDGVTELASVPSADLYRGLVYAVGAFADGSIYHFYNGARVTDWYDGSASAQFTVVSGDSTPTTVDDIQVNGVSIILAPVDWAGSSADTAADIATAINSYSSTPEYTAVADGAVVTLRSSTPGEGANGYVVLITTTGTVVTPTSTVLSGGYAPSRAPGTFTVTGGGSGAGSKASTTFSVKRRASEHDAVGNMTALTINGVNIISGTVAGGLTNETFASAIAAAINSHTSSPDYTATAFSNIVTVTTATNTAAVNGKSVSATITSTGSITPSGPMSGGAAAYSSAFADVKVDGVSIIGAPVAWAGSNAATAAALSAAINSHTSSPDYTSTVDGATISLEAVVPASVPDGAAVVFTLTDGMTVTPSTLTLPNTPTIYQPGNFVKTIGQKMHATSGSVLHFSGIREPTKWTTDATGAGFIDMSEENSGSEELTALAKYQNYIAVFAERAIQIWYTDPDPTLNRQTQTLNNTGTASAKSVTSFGDTDIFYLDESGLRSLRARDSSNAAATTDIGVPVDGLVTAKLAALDDDERKLIVGLIEPVDGRFWLVMRDLAYVFSYFPGSRISAWSQYQMTYINELVETTAFSVDNAVAFRRRVYLRSGDRIFVYSGLSGDAYDATVAEAWLPYMDAGEPAKNKQFTGLDVAMRGAWVVSAAMSVANQDAEDKVAQIIETTFDHGGRVPLQNTATHVSLRFRSYGEGPHKLASCAIHFEGKEKSQ